LLKPGPKPKPDAMKKLAGTFRKHRAQPKPLPVVDDQAPVMPVFLEGRAAELWRERIAAYDARRLNVRGAERVLAHLCALDASMEAAWLRGETPTAAQTSALRSLSSLFYETPGSQPGGGALNPPSDPPPASPWDQVFRDSH